MIDVFVGGPPRRVVSYGWWVVWWFVLCVDVKGWMELEEGILSGQREAASLQADLWQL
eukprot:CAMPEP_0118823772 /NCGR_PEP_ID=MMETSP1162-20130426/10135_1 /TAXON_ID=33656 /ORGANISM="Phaeocystis Sp, Strain CCMP2710" /LENGTH=57 /DNA_ID=CAMNT_0006754387 /DNA_START=130 /DNA_END=299 /DNA_ORIENTATION=+